MDAHQHRESVRQLADDFSWLEDHCKRQPELAAHAARLRFAAALTRNVIGPAVDDRPTRPLFLAVVGGAGAGKSTVVNFLCGAVVAEANPQAGYTRHPTAFLPVGHSAPWPTYNGFLGPLQRLTESRPGNVDEDVYQVKPVSRPSGSGQTADPLADFVIWDCPDMTTWASSGYVSRLMEVVALADVVVYVASDERYNDEVPTQFLHLLVKAGKAVVVCLTKMREGDAATLTDHFRREVLGKLPQVPESDIPPVPCVALPQMPAEVRADPGGLGAKFRVQLINQILVLCPSPELARSRTVHNAMIDLETSGEGLLNVAQRDLAELEIWRNLVAQGKKEFEDRYRREFLAGESFRRFDRTREQVMEMLELPGPGRILSTILGILRTPYKYLRDAIVKTLIRPDTPNLSEHVICTAALTAWLDGLQAESLRRSGTHPVWKLIVQGFDTGLKTQAIDRFQQVFRTFELKETDELDQAARAVPDYLSQHPGILQSARIATIAFDLTAAGLTIGATMGTNWQWYHLLWIPVAVSLSRQLVEWLVQRIVDSGRNRIRDHREALVQEHLTGPLSTWLADWPISSGSSMEKLKQVLARVPTTIRKLGELLNRSQPPAAQ